MRSRQTLAQKDRDRALGDSKVTERRDNCQRVYDLILIHGKMTTTQINEELKFINFPLSKRTIERCIKDDPRIIKNKRYYSINEESRFETRYLNPKELGSLIYDYVISKKPFQYNDAIMANMVEIFGAILMFLFIEASRPFKDKVGGNLKMMGYTDRNDLVTYWARNSIPLDSMFLAFRFVFNFMRKDKSKFVSNKPGDLTQNEMDTSQINECLAMLERKYPDIYKDLISAKNEFYNKFFSKAKQELS